MNNLFKFILDFHRKHRVLTHFLFWLFILVSGSLNEILNDNIEEFNFLERLAVDFLNNFAKIPTAYIVVYYLFPRSFEEKKYISSIFLFILMGYLIYIITSIIKIITFPYLGITFLESEPIKSLLNDPKGFYQFFFFKNLGGGAGMLLIKMIINYSETQHKVLTYEKRKVEIELKSLKNQLNPHFLFNTLNNIYALSIKNSTKTTPSIARLSEILDYVLYRCNETMVPLKNEIDFLENYIELEKLRYNEKLKIDFIKDIEIETEIAPLILLTLVENAFKHGAAEVLKIPRINIYLKARTSGIEFKVTNSCLPNINSKNSNGIGLQNLRQQLELIYGTAQSFNIERTENEFLVILNLKSLNRIV